MAQPIQGGNQLHGIVSIGSLAMLASFFTNALGADVGFAGFAYAGDFDSIRSRFPFTSQIIPPRAADSGAEASAAEKLLLDRVRAIKPKNFNLEVGSLATLEGREQAIMVALVATGETVSTERIGDFTKLFINLRAQALFFDFKTMTVLRAYPISVVYLGATPSDPNNAEELAKVQDLLGVGAQSGLIGHFFNLLGAAALPGAATRFIGVSDVTIAPAAASMLPPYLAADGVAETWLADTLSEALMDKTGVALMPFSRGYAIGNSMATRFADGTVFNLKLHSPDYPVTLELQALKKVKFGDVSAGSSFIYGAFARLTVQEPLLHHVYFDAVLKNGESKSVPAGQSNVDDWPAYKDAISGLFEKFAATVSGTDTKWIRSSVASDVTAQIAATRTVVNSCK
jgi:hypothetical protein